ncbi:MAG: hypothetical protein R3211_03735 [Balneolaceae bacterium]|nr:hypothetical protein [Balneolaceae bacterium]
MEIHLKDNNDIDRLMYWLNFELAGSVLFLISFLHFIAIYFVGLAALAILPLMLKVLIRQKRYGWLAFLFILVGLPTLLVYLLINYGDLNNFPTPLLNTSIFLAYIPIGMFYLYCFLLRLVIPEWAQVEDYRYTKFKRHRWHSDT